MATRNLVIVGVVGVIALCALLTWEFRDDREFSRVPVAVPAREANAPSAVDTLRPIEGGSRSQPAAVEPLEHAEQHVIAAPRKAAVIEMQDGKQRERLTAEWAAHDMEGKCITTDARIALTECSKRIALYRSALSRIPDSPETNTGELEDRIIDSIHRSPLDRQFESVFVSCSDYSCIVTVVVSGVTHIEVLGKMSEDLKNDLSAVVGSSGAYQTQVASYPESRIYILFRRPSFNSPLP